ncbi:MAG: hypothetical protein IJ691_03585 [Lachnospiraceae bacterium]|nr:hypothetical protein [Lachnospiraceae bacterium]
MTKNKDHYWPCMVYYVISCQTTEIFKNIRAVSKEQVCDGNSVIPYIAVDGVVISGK